MAGFPAARCTMQADLPLPDDDACAHSERLAAFIRNEIAAEGGSIPFASWRQPLRARAGLLQRGQHQVRRSGRFHHRAGAGAAVRQLRGAGGAGTAAAGPGSRVRRDRWRSGAFAEIMLKRLLELDALPTRYAILEPSADLRERQRERLGAGSSCPCSNWSRAGRAAGRDLEWGAVRQRR